MINPRSQKPEPQLPSELIEVGDVVATHGLRGDLKVRLRSGDPDVLLDVDTVTLRRHDGTTQVASVVRQSLHKGQILLRFREFEEISLAETLIGCCVLLKQSELPALGNDEYYWGDLEGMQVVDQQHGDLGQLIHIFTTAAHDTYVVEGSFGEVMIPAVKQFVLSIDFEKRLMRVALPDGLVTEKE